MIGAARRPTLALEKHEHLCPRCGIQYRDTSARWKPVAPCRDCRPWFDGLDEFRTALGLHRPSQAGPRKPYTREQLDRKNALARQRRREARGDAA